MSLTLDAEVLARFWAHVAVSDPDACWEWRGTLSKGYGQISIHCRLMATHRLAYELTHGAIPVGLQLDHLCRNRACCNPAHLEPVTQQENIRRGLGGSNHSTKTHCPSGHPYDEENTHWYARKDGYVERRCRACKAAANARRFAA